MAEERQLELESVSERCFRDTLARWPSGVTVVTARDGDEPVGMTAASFSSLSLDPPLVLVCVARDANSHDALVAAPGFAVHILGSAQDEVSRQFAEPGPLKFEDYPDQSGPFDVPLLPFGVALPGLRPPLRPRRRRSHDPDRAGRRHRPRRHRPARLLQPGLLADQRDHLIVHPTGAVSARLGEPPSSTASSASRR